MEPSDSSLSSQNPSSELQATFSLRLATPDDASGITRVWLERLEKDMAYDEAAEKYFAKRLEDCRPPFGVLVLVDSSCKIVAWQSFMEFRASPSMRPTMAEFSTYVGTAIRGTGLGAHVMISGLLFIEGSNLEWVIGYVDQQNQAMLSIIQKCGFDIAGELPKVHSNPSRPATFIVRYEVGHPDRDLQKFKDTVSKESRIEISQELSKYLDMAMQRRKLRENRIEGKW